MSQDKQNFLWGVATSAYQSEGGLNGDNQPVTNWTLAERDAHVAELGASTRFLDHYKEDFQRCQQMGLSAFRMGICWSRVQPSKQLKRTHPPEFDDEALDVYADMLASCRQNGMEPVLTLHHFVHPGWLSINAWLEKTTIAHFVDYVKYSVRYLNEKLVEKYDQKPLQWYITTNEPNMLVLNTYIGIQFPSESEPNFENSIAAYNNLLCAHIEAYNAVHDIYEERGWDRPKVTFNNYCNDLYWSDKVLLDLMHMRVRGISRDGISDYLREKAAEHDQEIKNAGVKMSRNLAYKFGILMKWVSEKSLGGYFVNKADLTPLYDALEKSQRADVIDYIGLDYYDPFSVHTFRLPKFFDHELHSPNARSWVMNAITSKWWDWRVLPEGLHFFCEYFTREYGKSALIAENGLAIRRKTNNKKFQRHDKMTRSKFLELHVAEIHRILDDGIPLVGYLHWSLFDNYEWGTYAPRFGIYSIDYDDPDRTRHAVNHDGDNPSKTYTRLIKDFESRAIREEG